jgi:hypothetical protein
MTTNKKDIIFTEPILDQIQTENFMIEMHAAMMEFNYFMIYQLFQKYELIDKNDFASFLTQFEGYIMSERGNEKSIMSVKTFDSQCIMCAFGSKVKAYKITLGENNNKMIFKNKVAIKYQIQNQKLIDFQWCNKFR